MNDLEVKTSVLIGQMQRGNDDAFEALYRLYARYALRTAYLITYEEHLAADVVQEAFLKVYRKIDRFDVDRPFNPWFYTILVNESKRYLKRKSNEPMVMDSEQLLDYIHHQQSIDVEIEYEALQKAFRALSHFQRTVIVLKYVHDFLEKEMAEILQVNINTVKSRLYKGREKLRTILGGNGHEGSI